MIAERAGSVTDKILKPIINDNDCRSQILLDMNFYIQIINNGGDESNDLRKAVETLANNFKDSQLVEFGRRINAIKEE